MRSIVMSAGVTVLGLVVAAGTVLPAWGQEVLEATSPRGAAHAELGRLALKTERVVAFKDGYGLIVKSAMGVADEKGRVFTDEVPEAVLGCFWATSEDGKAIGMRAEWVEQKGERSRRETAVTMVELLRANIGRPATLTLVGRSDGKETERIRGKVTAVLERAPETVPETEQPVSQPAAGEAGAEPRRVVTDLTPSGAQFVVVDTEDGKTIVPIADVRSLAAADVQTSIDRRERIVEKSKRLSFDAKPGARVSLRLYYFAPGVRWIPTYRLEGIETGNPRLDLQAELMNDLGDLGRTPVDLVAGVPNFRFKSVVSPLSLEKTLRRTLVSTLGRGQSQLSNAMFSQRASEWRQQEQPTETAEGAPPMIGGVGEQDLYVYSAGEQDLGKGVRLTMPLWSAEAPARHIYTLNVDANQEVRPEPQERRTAYSPVPLPEDSEGFEGAAASPLKLSRHRVWHQLELTNTGERPWTTGPALVLKGSLPLSQELLTYTPSGGKTRLPLTVAVDVRGDFKEIETARKPDAMSWSSHSYGQVWKRGTIEIRNYRKEPATVCITSAVPGKVEKASDDGKIEIDDYRPEEWAQQNSWSRVNNHSDVTWEFDLKPGESKAVTFEYTYYAW